MKHNFKRAIWPYTTAAQLTGSNLNRTDSDSVGALTKLARRMARRNPSTLKLARSQLHEARGRQSHAACHIEFRLQGHDLRSRAPGLNLDLRRSERTNSADILNKKVALCSVSVPTLQYNIDKTYKHLQKVGALRY